MLSCLVPFSLCIRLVPEYRSPWPTHVGLCLAINRTPRHIHARVLWVPRSFPHPVDDNKTKSNKNNKKGKNHPGGFKGTETITEALHDDPLPAAPLPAPPLWSECVALTFNQKEKPQRKNCQRLRGNLSLPFADRAEAVEKVSARFSFWCKTIEIFHLKSYNIPEHIE